MEEISETLGDLSITEVPIPSDCTDGFLGAYWKRPDAYLIPEVRNAISTFSKIRNLEVGLAQLRQDLESGEWSRRNSKLDKLSGLDLGYRLIVADLDA